MKCQILFSWKIKKNIINLSSAENAQRVVKVKTLSQGATSVDDVTSQNLLTSVKNVKKHKIESETFKMLSHGATSVDDVTSQNLLTSVKNVKKHKIKSEEKSFL